MSAVDWSAETTETFVTSPGAPAAPQEQRNVGIPEFRISRAATFSVA